MAFALFGGLAGFGIGNMVQSNSIAAVVESGFGVPVWLTGIVLTLLTGFVLLGGIKRIGAVAEKLVPFMCIGYIVVALLVLVRSTSVRSRRRFGLIFSHAFSPVAATGGFAGATIMLAMRYGVARGIFSNEAGLGTAGIAQAAGQSKNAAQSGLIGMMGTFIDTLIVCTMTGLVIMVTGVWSAAPRARRSPRAPSRRRCRASAATSSRRRWRSSPTPRSSAGPTTARSAGSSWSEPLSRSPTGCSGRCS